MGIIVLLSKLGVFVQKTYFGKLIVLAGTIIGSAFYKGNRKVSFSTFLAQTFFTGVEAIPHISLLAVAVGALTILQAVTLMPKLGGGDALGGIMVAVVLRELGPLLTAMFLAGRTGSAMSTYIGNMRVFQEVDALEAMGIDPLHYQIMPSFFATVVSMFCLTMIFGVMSVLGGYFVVWNMIWMFPGMFTAHLSFILFIEKLFLAMNIWDMLFTIVKPLVFGVIVSVVACYHGMSVSTDVRDVPKATRMTVVRSFIFILIGDLAMSFPILAQIKEKLLV